MPKTSVLITIDGPAASGKGTLAKKLAKHFSFRYLDSGLMYRAVASIMLEKGGNPAMIARFLALEDLERRDLRSEEVSNATPEVAKLPEVRNAINAFIRLLIHSSKGSVIDGRDGAREFPEADVKIFLDASVGERAARRHRQLLEAGWPVSYEQVLSDLKVRDQKDRERSVSPMMPADDSYIIQSDQLDAEGVFQLAVTICAHWLHGVRN